MDLSSDRTSFEIDALVLNTTGFSGTPGPVTQLEGTLVCNAGLAQEAVLDTAPVSLDSPGNAEFSGVVSGIPDSCDNPLFLIRIVTPNGALGRWIATRAERTSSGIRNRSSAGDD